MSKKDASASPGSVRQNEPNMGGDVARDRRFRLVKHFLKLNPPTYAGIEGPEAVEEFINRAEKIFKLLKCSSREKVVLATYSLQREAYAWWRASRASIELDYAGDEWERFRQALIDKYFPFTIREDKAREFDRLQQTEEMTVDQYEAKFSKLSRYAPELVDTPVKRTRKFERGLLPRIQNHVAALMLTNYGELYKRAQKIEKTLRECRERELEKEKKQLDEGSSRMTPRSVKRGRFLMRGGVSSTPRYSGYVQGSEMMDMSPRACRRYAKWYSGWPCPEEGNSTVRCYQCGQPGHIRWNCPQNQRIVSTGMSIALRGCGGATRSQSSRGSASQGREHGRVNAITEQEAARSKKIISGTIMINGRRVYALFVTGVTHSFISGECVDRVGMVVDEAKEALVVRLSDGMRISTRGVCRDCGVMVNAMCTEIDLVVFQISDFDVILDMDWPERNHANVDCEKKEIVFWRPNQRPCTYSGYESGETVAMVSALKACRILEDGGETSLAVVERGARATETSGNCSS